MSVCCYNNPYFENQLILILQKPIDNKKKTQKFCKYQTKTMKKKNNRIKNFLKLLFNSISILSEIKQKYNFKERKKNTKKNRTFFFLHFMGT